MVLLPLGLQWQKRLGLVPKGSVPRKGKELPQPSAQTREEPDHTPNRI